MTRHAHSHALPDGRRFKHAHALPIERIASPTADLIGRSHLLSVLERQHAVAPLIEAHDGPLFTRQTAGRWAYQLEVGDRAAAALLDETSCDPNAQLVESYNLQHPLADDRWTAADLPQHSIPRPAGPWAVWRFERAGYGAGYQRDPDPASPWFQYKYQAERWRAEHIVDLGPLDVSKISHVFWAECHRLGEACYNCRRRELEARFAAEPCPKNPDGKHQLPLGSLTGLGKTQPLIRTPSD